MPAGDRGRTPDRIDLGFVVVVDSHKFQRGEEDMVNAILFEIDAEQFCAQQLALCQNILVQRFAEGNTQAYQAGRGVAENLNAAAQACGVSRRKRHRAQSHRTESRFIYLDILARFLGANRHPPSPQGNC